MVDADERGRPLGEPLDHPLSNASASPVLPRDGWRLDFLRGGQTVGCVNAQTLETRLGLLGNAGLALGRVAPSVVPRASLTSRVAAPWRSFTVTCHRTIMLS